MAAADLAQVLAIAKNLPEAPHWPQSTYLKAIDPNSSPRRIALVILGSDAESGLQPILGFAIASLLAPQAEIETIAVAGECQRQGLGRQLLQALIANLKALSVNEVFLEVRSSNCSAIAFYWSFGFIQTGLRPGYYTDPVDHAVLMRLPLA